MANLLLIELLLFFSWQALCNGELPRYCCSAVAVGEESEPGRRLRGTFSCGIQDSREQVEDSAFLAATVFVEQAAER